MARISKTKRPRSYGARNLLTEDSITVCVASFTFHFENAEQVRGCLKYYELKTRPSSRVSLSEIRKVACGRWCTERWFERLPMYLLEEPKRQKVVKALRRTLDLIESGKIKQ